MISIEDPPLKHHNRALVHEFTEGEALLLYDFKTNADNYSEIQERLYDRYLHYQPIAYDNSLFCKNGKMGLQNNVFGTELIPPLYDEIPNTTPKGFYAIAINNRKYGLVKADGKGSIILPFGYDFIGELGQTHYIAVYEVVKDGKCGILSVSRDITHIEVEPVYDLVSHELFSEFILLKKERKCGLWSLNCFIPPLYDDIFVPEVLGWVLVKYQGQWGYIDVNLQFTTDKESAFLYSERC